MPPRVVAACPEALLVAIGGEPADALHGGSGGGAARVRTAAASAGVQDHLRFLGSASDAELSEAYQAADVLVFPVRDLAGDVQGFGMAASTACRLWPMRRVAWLIPCPDVRLWIVSMLP